MGFSLMLAICMACLAEVATDSITRPCLTWRWTPISHWLQRCVCSQLVSLNLVHSMSTSFGSVSSQPLLISAAQNLVNSFVATFAGPQPQSVLFLCIIWPLDKATYVASIIFFFRMNTGDHRVQDQRLLLGHPTSSFYQLHNLRTHPTLSTIFTPSNMLKTSKTTKIGVRTLNIIKIYPANISRWNLEYIY